MDGDWVVPPMGFDVRMIPAGDPAARHLEEDPAQVPDKPFARIKRDPERRYRITGRIPPHFEVRFASEYGAYGRDTAACQQRLGGQPGNLAVFGGISVPVSLRRLSPERYEAVLVIDRFEDDDPCRWVYQGTRIQVINTRLTEFKDPTPFPNEGVIGADRYHISDSVPRCTPRHYRCSEERLRTLDDSSSAPAIQRCETMPPSPDFPMRSLRCNRYPGPVFKKAHLLRPGTGTITLNIYDLGKV